MDLKHISVGVIVTLAMGSLTACSQQAEVAQPSESPSICAQYQSQIEDVESWAAGGSLMLLVNATMVLRWDFGYSKEQTDPRDISHMKLIESEIATVFGSCLSVPAIYRLTNGPWK